MVIEIKLLEESDIEKRLLESFERYQETYEVWYKDEEGYNVKKDYFVDDWDIQRKEMIADYLRETLMRGGSVVGAFLCDKLIGFCNLEYQVFKCTYEGIIYNTVEMPYLHVSKAYRGKGIGKRLMKACIEEARKKQIQAIYIGAHPNSASQAFYKKIGFVYAEEINKEIYEREPLDLQMLLRIAD